MRKQKKKSENKIYVETIEMKILLKILLKILSNWCEKYLQINMWKRSIFRTKQKQKQQNDIDFANVCCFKLFEFEFFEFLLIDRFWLTANFETKQNVDASTIDKKLRKKRIDLIVTSVHRIQHLKSTFDSTLELTFLFYHIEC